MAKHTTPEFRMEAARLVVEGGVSLDQAARDLGINKWTLRGWVRKLESESGARVRSTQTVEQENIALKRENATLKQERDLLKKAAAYFAREQQEPHPPIGAICSWSHWMLVSMVGSLGSMVFASRMMRMASWRRPSLR